MDASADDIWVAKAPSGLRFGPLGSDAIHLCVDMQNMFARGTEWSTPWVERMLPNIVTLAHHHPDRLAFTRFIPLAQDCDGHGTWQRYYRRYQQMTRGALDPSLLELVPPLDRLAPPAPTFDKKVYSPWWTPNLNATLRAANISTLIISGGETEVCVLATVIGAIDLGYRVVIAEDALCSSANATHDAMLDIYHSRFGMQVETAKIAEIMESWA